MTVLYFIVFKLRFDGRICCSMDTYRIPVGEAADVESRPCEDTLLCQDKEEAARLLASLKKEIAERQERLFAEKKNKLLIVLQGMDAAGKDGTIRHVFSGIDPQGVQVATFSKPTESELAHDYLWRVHYRVPSLGEIGIFNRSHYEDVLAVRVRNLKPKEVWSKRFEHIKAFEKMLTDEGMTIIKLFLNISPGEQRTRLMRRRDTPAKQWKLIPQDVEDRKLWPRYMVAYNEAIERTNTPEAPWYVIPANKKWYRNVAVASIVNKVLAGINPQYPAPNENIGHLRI